MDSGDDIRRLLQEILDTQREHLGEYRRVTDRLLDLQQRAVARQEQIGNLYRRLILVGGGVAAALLFLLAYLLVRWWRPLFGI
jgi:ferric-dicitrate binding protein FerR (iron transport regulator)